MQYPPVPRYLVPPRSKYSLLSTLFSNTLRIYSSRNISDKSTGKIIVYLRIILSPEQASRLWMFLNVIVLQEGVVSTSANTQAEGPPQVGCPQLIIQFIVSYPPNLRPSLYPQPEDAPCRGDSEPLTQINLR